MSKLNAVAPFSMVPRQLLRAKGLSSSEYKLLMIVLSYCNPAIGQNVCWPRQQLLANDMECSKRQVIRLLQSLEEKGYLVIHENFRESKRSSNVYEIPMHYFTHELDLDKHKDQIKKNSEKDEELGSDPQFIGGGDIFDDFGGDISEGGSDIFDHSENNGDTGVTNNGDTGVTQKETREKQLVSYSSKLGNTARDVLPELTKTNNFKVEETTPTEKTDYRYVDVYNFDETELTELRKLSNKQNMTNQWVKQVATKFSEKTGFSSNVFPTKQKLKNMMVTHLSGERDQEKKQYSHQHRSNGYTIAGAGNHVSPRVQEILNRGAARAREATEQHDTKMQDYFDSILGKE